MMAAVYAPTFYGGIVLTLVGFAMWSAERKRRQERDEQKKEHKELVDAIRGRESTPSAPVESSLRPTEPAVPHHHSSSALGRWRARQ
jgi:hypothetical protein